jgi:hypothetical protein
MKHARSHERTNPRRAARRGVEPARSASIDRRRSPKVSKPAAPIDTTPPPRPRVRGRADPVRISRPFPLEEPSP